MTEKSKVVRISLETWNVLEMLAESSGLTENAILSEWTKQIESVLQDLGDFQRLTIMSYRPSNKDGKLEESVKTRLGAVFLNSEEFIERDLESDIDPEILANNRALEDFENKKVKFVRVKEKLGTLSQNKDGSLKFVPNKKSKVMRLRE